MKILFSRFIYHFSRMGSRNPEGAGRHAAGHGARLEAATGQVPTLKQSRALLPPPPTGHVEP